MTQPSFSACLGLQVYPADACRFLSTGQNQINGCNSFNQPYWEIALNFIFNSHSRGKSSIYRLFTCIYLLKLVTFHSYLRLPRPALAPAWLP